MNDADAPVQSAPVIAEDAGDLRDPITSLAVDWSEVAPVVAALVCAFLAVVGIIHLDEVAQRAQWMESSGLARGAIVDRFGHPLSASVFVRGGVVRSQSVPGLSPILGYRAGGAWHGLEAMYSQVLDATAARRDWRTYASHLLGRVERGGTVRLTLSRRVQAVAASALGSAKGAVVALDPRTGDVLALVSSPPCPASAGAPVGGTGACAAAAQMNRATSLTVSPGSDFKIVTLTAAIDSGRFHLSDTFSGADAFGPSPYFDNSLYPSNVTRNDLHVLTLSQALAFSDNFTFAHIGLTLGPRTLLQYAHRYMVDSRIPFEIPVAISSIADGKVHPSRAEVAQSAFGGPPDRVTPLQMALVAATVANGGVLMAPHLVQEIETAGGRVIQRYSPRPIQRVMKASTAAQITTAMSFVVNHGSGFKAQIPAVQVAGKTGTAASGAARPNAWFIAFAPTRHPRVAVAVLRQFSGEGFQYAAPIARKVIIAALLEDGFKVR